MVSGDDGITDVHQSIDVHVVLEVSVIEGDSGIISHQHCVTDVDARVAVHVADQESDQHAARALEAGWSSHVVHRESEVLLIRYTAQIYCHRVAAEAGATHVSGSGSYAGV